MKCFQFALIVFIAAIGSGCGRKDVAGSTDIGNPSEAALVTGTISNPAGLTRQGASVELYPADYVPPMALAKRSALDSIYAVQSDSAGNFRIGGVPYGHYNLVTRNASGDSVFLKAVVLEEAHVSAGLCTLNAAGALSVYAIGDGELGSGAVTIYLPGSPFGVTSTDSAAVILNGLPAGDHSIAFHGDSGTAVDAIHVTPAETTFAGPVAVDHDTLVSLPPMVGDVQVHLNATHDTVSVRWMDPHATGNQFLVYRQLHGDTLSSPINNGDFHPVTGQPGYFEFWDLRLSIPAAGHYSYWVRQQDAAGRLGQPGHSIEISIP